MLAVRQMFENTNPVLIVVFIALAARGVAQQVGQRLERRRQLRKETLGEMDPDEHATSTLRSPR